jgi:hypothetical protein
VIVDLCRKIEGGYTENFPCGHLRDIGFMTSELRCRVGRFQAYRGSLELSEASG